jgi:transposase
MNVIDEINVFLKKSTDGQEIKRALAVKMILQGEKPQQITKLLQVSSSFISKWKNQVLLYRLNKQGKGKKIN